MEWRSATPSGLSRAAHLVEEFAVMADADMLEHADRDDAVEAALDLAVVHELELRPAAQARPARARSLDSACCSLDSVTPTTSAPQASAR